MVDNAQTDGMKVGRKDDKGNRVGVYYGNVIKINESSK